MRRSASRGRRIRTTLLELVGAVREAAASGREAIAAMRDWLERGTPRTPVAVAQGRSRRRR